MRRLIALCFATCFLILAGCLALPRYSVESEPETNFSQFSTYELKRGVSDKPVVKIHSNVEEQLRLTLGNTLKKAGYVPAVKGVHGDLEVSYRLESRWDPRLTPEEIRQRLGFSGSNFPDPDPRARNYQILTLILEVTSSSDKKVLWTGKAEPIDYNFSNLGRSLLHAAEDLIEEVPEGAGK